MRPTTGNGRAMIALALVTISLGIVAALAIVLIHPVAGLALMLVPVAFGALLAWEGAVYVAYVFLIALVPTYLRLPGISFIHPLSLLLWPLLGLAVLRIVLRPGALRWSPLHTLAVMFLLAVAVTSVHPQFDGTSIRVVYYQALVPIAGFALVFHALRERKDVGPYLDALTASAAVASAYGIVEYVIGHNPLVQTFLIDSGIVGDTPFYVAKEDLPALGLYRIGSTFINPIEFATFIGMVLPHPILAAIHHPSRLRKVLYVVSGCLITIALVLTFSRGSLLAVVPAVGILMVREPAFRRTMVPLGIVATAGAAIAYPFFAAELGARVGDMDTVSTRWGLLRLATMMFFDHPVLGVGYDNFKNFIVEYAQRYGDEEFRFPAEWFTLCENTYLQLLSEMGLVGLISHLAILAAFLWACLRGARRGGVVGWQATAVGLGGLVYMLNGLGSGAAVVFFQATQAFWILLALGGHLGGLQPAPAPRASTGDRSTTATGVVQEVHAG